MTPMISNSCETRFLFGTFADADHAPVFQGAVVIGSEFTYDAVTKLPTGGMVNRIVVQTRGTVEVIETHAAYSDINANVTDLNAAFADADAPWFDASDVLPAVDLDENAPLNLDVELNSAQMDELTSGQNALHLKTGEVLSAHELSSIFATESAKVRRQRRQKAKKRNAQKKASNANVVALKATYENVATSNYSDLDIETLENDLRFSAL